MITGVGKAGYIAQNMAVTFNSGGTNAQFLNPLDAVHGDLGLLGPDDVLIAISNSGKTRETIELIPLAQNLSYGIPIISITGQGNSALAKLSAYVLLTGNPNEVCPLGKMPTTSKTVMSVISDIITMGLMEKIGFTMEEYAKRHHGGYLGEQARAESSEGLDLKKDG